MSRYEGRHRLADTEEIKRILGLADAPERTMEEIASNREPAWTSATMELPVLTRPKHQTFPGPPVWRLTERMKWILSWRTNDKLQPHQNSLRLV